jgi:hypothetical protein
MLPYVERKEEVESYFQPRHVRINSDSAAYATNQVADLVRSRLHPASLEHAYSKMPRGTNLGLPLATADGKYRRVVYELARFVERNGFSYPPDPCMLYWRGQPKGLELLPKQRTVWGPPHYHTLHELRVQIAYLAYLRRDTRFSAWVGNDEVDLAVTHIFDIAEHDILSVDFSGFDASIPEYLIRTIFDIMRFWFDSASAPLIDYLEKVFLTIGLLTPEGIKTERDGGVPSGNANTNGIDTFVQQWAIHYIAHRLRNEVIYHLAQGDDGVVVFRRPWRIEDVIEVADELNLDISGSKGGVSQRVVHYLQNVYHRDYRPDGICRGIRPGFRFLNGALSFERFHKDWKPEDNTLRWRQQLDNCRWHPRFREMVEWLYENDTYSEYSSQQLIDAAGGLSKVESALGQSGYPYGKTPVSRLDRSAVGRELRRLYRRTTEHQSRNASDFVL